MTKKCKAFGRTFEASPRQKDEVMGYDLSATPVYAGDDESWKCMLQTFWCPKHVFELLYTEV